MESIIVTVENILIYHPNVFYLAILLIALFLAYQMMRFLSSIVHALKEIINETVTGKGIKNKHNHRLTKKNYTMLKIFTTFIIIRNHINFLMEYIEKTVIKFYKKFVNKVFIKYKV